MRVMKTGLLAFSASTLGLGFPVSAQEPLQLESPVEEVAETLVIPFDPPIGTPLLYTMTFEKKGKRGSGPVTMEQRLTFERIDTGYLLKLDHVAIVVGEFRGDLADPRILNAMPAGLRPFVMPLTIELDEAGKMVRMHDWDELKKALAKLPSTIAVMEGDAPDSAASKVVEQVMAPMLNASAERAPAIIIRGWPDVLGYGGLAMDEGEPYETLTDEGDDVAVSSSGVLTLKRAATGNYNLRQTITYDPDSLAQMTRSVQETLTEAGAQPPKNIPANDPDKISMMDEIDYTFDAKTGLPVVTTLRRIVSAQGEGVGGEVTTIRRIEK